MNQRHPARLAAAASAAAILPLLAIALAGTATAAAPDDSAEPVSFTAVTDARQGSFQVYACDPATSTYRFARPQAILTTPDGDTIGHFAGPTWVGPDGSVISGTVTERIPQGPRTIPELVLTATNDSAPDSFFGGVTTIRRTETVGGVGVDGRSCVPGRDGERRVPYRATYVFE